jgi:hypothetical protein
MCGAASLRKLGLGSTQYAQTTVHLFAGIRFSKSSGCAFSHVFTVDLLENKFVPYTEAVVKGRCLGKVLVGAVTR